MNFILPLLISKIRSNSLKVHQVQEEHLQESTKKYRYDLHIPVILGLENEALSNQIEEDIQKDVNTFINELKTVANEYIILNTPYTLESTYEIYHQDENFISFCILFSNYYGGAHEMTYKICYNYDVRSGKRLKLKDLFKDSDYELVINQFISNEIKKRNELFGYKVINGFKGIGKNQKFYIKDGLLVIYFGLYEIAPYVAGIIEFSIPKNIYSIYD